MDKFGVQLHLAEVNRANGKWLKAYREFRAAREKVLRFLVHEGLSNFMSPRDIALHGGLSAKRVRDIMRANGLAPKDGKRALSDQASKALMTNTSLMGIKPEQMDLTSPLAYLPMGDDLRRALQEKTTSQVKEFPETRELTVDEALNALDVATEDYRQALERAGE